MGTRVNMCVCVCVCVCEYIYLSGVHQGITNEQGATQRRYIPNATKLKKMVMPTREAVAGAVKNWRYWIWKYQSTDSISTNSGSIRLPRFSATCTWSAALAPAGIARVAFWEMWQCRTQLSARLRAESVWVSSCRSWPW